VAFLYFIPSQQQEARYIIHLSFLITCFGSLSHQVFHIFTFFTCIRPLVFLHWPVFTYCNTGSLVICNAVIRSVPGGKVNILGGHSIGHSKQKSLYVRVLFRTVSQTEILRTVSNTGIYC
jgi:hypothetical protein